MLFLRNIPIQVFTRRAKSLGYECLSGARKEQNRGWMAIDARRVRDGVLGVLRLRWEEQAGWLPPQFTPSAVAVIAWATLIGTGGLS